MIPSILEYASEYLDIFCKTFSNSRQTVEAWFCLDAAGFLRSSEVPLIAGGLFAIVAGFPAWVPFAEIMPLEALGPEDDMLAGASLYLDLLNKARRINE